MLRLFLRKKGSIATKDQCVQRNKGYPPSSFGNSVAWLGHSLRGIFCQVSEDRLLYVQPTLGYHHILTPVFSTNLHARYHRDLDFSDISWILAPIVWLELDTITIRFQVEEDNNLRIGTSPEDTHWTSAETCLTGKC